MAKHVMLDLETLSLEEDCILLSIGAVRFDGDQLYDRFHIGIDPVDAQRCGLRIDADTAWNYWCNPKRDAARAKLYDLPKLDLFAAVDGFGMWYSETPRDEQGSCWGKGSVFDIPRIKNAFKVCGLDVPFSYRQEECYRTMANRCPEVKYVQVGIAHDALDDAMSQAIHLQAICRDLGIAL